MLRAAYARQAASAAARFCRTRYISSERSSCFRTRLVRAQIDLLVLHRPPESPHENVVTQCTLSIHAEPNAKFFGDERDEVAAGELAVLIGVEFLGVHFLGFRASAIERRDGFFKQLHLQFQDEVGVDVEFLGQLGHRKFAANAEQRHLHFENR